MDKWGIKFLIDGKWVDLKDLVEKAEKWDSWTHPDQLTDEAHKILKDDSKKLDAVKSWWSVFNQTIDSPDAKDRLAEVLDICRPS